MTDDRRPSSLPPAAATALLTLQLRAALREADEAEAAVAAVDLDRARHDLRAKIDGIQSERSAALEAELANEREAAAAVVATARAEADSILAAARLHAADLASMAVVTAPAPTLPTPTQPVVEVLEHAPALIETAESTDEIELRATVESALARVQSEVPTSVGGSITVDSEAFARVFATVLATVLDERFAAWRSSAPVGALGAPSYVDAGPAKKSLARRVFQLDTVLMAMASAIAIVLLFAWLG